MAKKTAAAVSESAKPAKTSTARKAPVRKATPALNIETACELALDKLRAMDIEHPLQADLQWCLGSYRGDGNPIGLYQMAERALAVFQREKATGSKAIPAKLISDLTKVLKP